MEAKRFLNLPAWASKLTQIPPEKQLWIVSFLTLSAALGIGLFGIQSPFQQRRGELESQYGKEQRRSSVLSGLSAIKGQLDKLQSALLIQGGTPALTRQVTKLASTAGVQIDSVSPQPEMTFGPYSRVQIRLLATSTYAQLLAFLQLLEGHEPLLKIDQLEVGEPVAPAAVSRPPGAVTSPPATRPFPDTERAPSSDRQSIRLLIGAFSQRRSSP